MESEQRKNAIRGAYHLTGSNNFYDGMITCSTFSGKAVCRMVWAMNRRECEDYLSKALSGIRRISQARCWKFPSARAS